MIAGIIRWSLRDRLFVLVGSLLLLLWGGYETLRTPVDVFPDLTAPTVTVVVEAPGTAPQELETLVTFPIEPRLIVALGKVAAHRLLGRDATLGSLRKTVHQYRGIPLVVTYHPAYLLRNLIDKAKAWEDLRFAVDTMSGLADATGDRQ